ncbi:protein transport protein Sec61 subunit beta-like [Paramacrobiotus metropolitanus]|uniref:protein transport protein Sec61 subunit beta-like n=1 Tax=Paramacrobiotus metropolitanus TaxID=2943436 RepID=UPI002445669E|nr:protein transport protein Sec61 subunit beta-like [Paramacrobiotus metropolitanus]XP_055353363.1 protein transport protein Sec61 subunit beta-like [Paramacrobiotus metropolitanus]XP_055353383.1 protein transport protein Sec61 subunit beta-like [Paramacrobiotus metropolitanus]XP_055353384.1 protein transport protein Sec61 subunit beta-like [Paramacrobiotus metropolitanus]
MAVKPASSTTVGASPRGGTRPAGGKAGAGDAGRARKTGGSGTAGTRTTRTANAGSSGMWRFYSDDSPGVRVGPVPVLVMSLLFIASVFVLHIWGKYSRG